MGNYGIKVTKAGYSTTTTTITEQIFNSEKNCLKIALDGDLSGTGSVVGGSVQLEHGLDETPGFLAFFEVNNSGLWFPIYGVEQESSYYGYVDGYTDATYVTFYLYASSNITIKVHYIVFIDPGE